MKTTIKIHNTTTTVSYVSTPTRVEHAHTTSFHMEHNNPTIMGMEGIPMTEGNIELAREALIQELNAWKYDW